MSIQLAHPVNPPSLSRRKLAGLGAAVALALPGTINAARQATPAVSAPDQILTIVRQVMDELSLRSTIIRVEIDGEEVLTEALGESMTGVPATPDMHFRNGAVAISLVSTLMLTLVDDGTIGLDDPIAPYLPDLPDADRVTFRMLSNMTAGYRDHVRNDDFVDLLQDDPFLAFTPDQILEYSLSQPRLFEPGANWEYSHANYFILGLALEVAAGQPVEQLMQARVLDPLGLANTANHFTPELPEPALHTFTSERRGWLGIEPGTRFYEESTYWNPSWTITQGAVQTTNIRDFAASMIAVGEGTLLSPESSAAQLNPGLLGFGEPIEGCVSCRQMNEEYNYGLGVVLRGRWIVQNPLFYGGSGVSAYLPGRRISIAVANTYREEAFDDEGGYSNASVPLFQAVADYLVPDLATPVS